MTLALAIMPVFNEADVLPWVLKHLASQDVLVWVLDNYSTDGSREIAENAPNVIEIERFPANKAENRYYPLPRIMRRGEVISAQYAGAARWCIWCDADDFLFSARAGESLAEGLDRLERDGWNSVDFRVVQFALTDDAWDHARVSPLDHFRYHDPASIESTLPHIRAWRAGPVDLSTAAHYTRIPDQRLAPERWTLKHYPLRSVAQAERKVLRERIPRYCPRERAIQWHVQYDEIARTRNWVRDPATLEVWRDG